MLKFYIIFLSLFASTLTISLDEYLRKRSLNKDSVSFGELELPADILHLFTEDEFDDYLEFWLEKKYESEYDSTIYERDGCSVPVNSLSDPQPVYEQRISPTSTSLKNPVGASGRIFFRKGESIIVSCPTSKLVHGSTTSELIQATVTCKLGNTFTSPGWLSKATNLGEIKCKSHIPSIESKTSSSCAAGQGVIIDIAIQSATKSHVIMKACYKESTLQALYVEYEQNPENKFNRVNVRRPGFSQGSWYPELTVRSLYEKKKQKSTIASIVGTLKANEYVTTTSFLARGHLAAKTDFIMSPSQRATFTFINVAPQWQSFNGGNWNTLEQNLRSRIGNTNRNIKVYTGTWGILKLKDSSGTGKEIYLESYLGKIPVPLWFYKIAYETATGKTTVFLGLNNPHVTLAEAEELRFCSDVCNGNDQFSWIRWNKNNVKQGYSICCDFKEFQKTVNHFPDFPRTSGLFY